MFIPLRERIRGWFHAGRHLVASRFRPSWLSKAGAAPLHLIRLFSRIPILFPLFGVIAALVITPFVAPPIPRLPEPTDTGVVLGTLLTAQGAIAALTLAVTLFMMQGIRARRDIDDRMYREHVRRTWMREILWGSLMAVGVTGVLLLTEGFISGDGASDNARRELSNFVLAAGSALIINLLLAGVLFERAILHSRPEHWLALRRDVNRADVREAIRAFMRRVRRALDVHEAGEPDLTILLPDQVEGSADDAMRALLDGARRAMSERRHEELRRSLDSVRELVRYAMDEIREADIQWGPPGSQPEWPPLRELSRNLYSFREDVIREGDREFILELLRFDYMLTAEGMRERCGELFTAGLSGYRWNYQIACRISDGEFREMLRDRFSLNSDSFILGVEPEEAFPYAMEMVRNQARLLSDAMHSGQPMDYVELHKGFQARLKAIRLHWDTDNWPPSQAPKLYQELERAYRIALMGLGGRAIILAQANRISDANPYLEVGRLAHLHVGPMADDLAPALAYGDSPYFSLWQEWEMESAEPYQTIGISTERYPLLFFALRLIELSSDTMPMFDLHGRARQVLDWFINNSDSVGTYVCAELDPTLEQRRELATDALHFAVRRDEVSEDYEIIGRDLSETRISRFKSEVYSAAFTGNAIERWFQQAGSRLQLSGDSDDVPEERVIRDLVHKGFLTNTPEGALVGYDSLRGDRYGRALSHDVLQRFCKMLEGATEVSAPLETITALLLGIDRAIEELDTPNHVVIVLAGDWFDFEVGLGTANIEGYEPSWSLSESDLMGEIGRYQGHLVLSARQYEDPCVYVVDPVNWGQFVRAKTDGNQDLRVDIKPISADRAHELLTSNPDLLTSQPDEESRLRKLQTHVEIVIGARTGFRVAVASRARRIVPGNQSDVDNETCVF